MRVRDAKVRERERERERGIKYLYLCLQLMNTELYVYTTLLFTVAKKF